MHIVHAITSLERGGAQAVLEILVASLNEQGYRQSIIYIHDGPYRERLDSLGIPLYQIKGFAASFDPLAWYRFYSIIKKLKPDILHALLWSTNLMARAVGARLSIPVLVVLHNNMDQNGLLRNSIDRFISYNNHALVAVSEQVRDSFYACQKGELPVTIIENGIDIDHIRSTIPVARHELGLTAEHFIIGSVGRFVPLKRYPLLFDAIALLLPTMPNLRLVIIGAGPQEQELRAYAQTRGIDHALIWIINEPAVAYYPLFDLFVMPSAKEGISMALLEAMSFGVAPLVMGDDGSHPVVTNGKNGFVAQGQNATDLADSIRHVAQNNHLRQAVGNSAQRDVVDRFSKNRMIAAYLALFDALVHQK